MNALLAYIDIHKEYVISQFLDSLEDIKRELYICISSNKTYL